MLDTTLFAIFIRDKWKGQTKENTYLRRSFYEAVNNLIKILVRHLQHAFGMPCLIL